MKTLALAGLIILAHGWYSRSCCGGEHCHPVPCEELKELPNGDVGWRNYIFNKVQVLPSEDRYCHVCTIGPRAICAYTQQGV